MRQIPPVIPTVPRRFQYLLAGQTFSRHRHRIPHVSIVLSGGFEEEGDYGRVRVGPGQFLLRRAFSSHSQRILQATKIFNAPLSLHAFPAVQSGLLKDPDATVRAWERDPREALALLLEQSTPLEATSQHWPDLLASTLRNGGGMQEWAADNGLHPASLARRFRRSYGAAPARYRTEYRARRAFQQILSTEEPLAAIAYDLGFSDQAHMCREVRSLTGLTPGQWRRLKKFKMEAGASCDTIDMNRREFNAGAAAGAAAILSGCARQLAAASPARPVASSQTTWSIIESEGYDALCFWAPLAGEPASSQHYADELRAFLPKFDPRALQTIKAVYQQVSAAGNVLTHSACRFFSAGPHSTIDELIQSASNIDGILKPRHLTDPEWEGEELWERYRQLMPLTVMILEAMKAADFQVFRQRLFAEKHAKRMQEVRNFVAPYDAVSEVQFLTGRQFEPNVEVALTYFSYPRGMRMLGQQFVTWAGYSNDIILNTSAHELMHPPLDLRGPAMQAAISKLFANDFFVRVVKERDPSLGDLGDLPNYTEECMVQALDQIASERRGSKRKAADFFSRNNGSDVLAACVYGLLKQDDYHRTGGMFEDWVQRAVSAGRFDAGPLEAAGRAVLGDSPRSVWKPFVPSQAS